MSTTTITTTTSIPLQSSTQSLRLTATPPDLPPSEDTTDEILTPQELTLEEKYTKQRKALITFTVAWVTLAASFASTSLFPATPEVAKDFNTSSLVIFYSNAAALAAGGLASFIWVPISKIVGRRRAYNACAFVFFAFSIGAALAKNVVGFTFLRIIAGLQVTYFNATGQAIVTDLYKPTERGMASGFYMLGSVIGPALGPCIGGVLVTFTGWRAIFWFQSGCILPGLIASYFLVPHDPRYSSSVTTKLTKEQVKKYIQLFNPLEVIRLCIYPNVLFVTITCATLSWTMYTLLTPPRYLINPRFNLTSPLVSGLFYIAPGAGFFLGALAGGKLSDITVKKHINKRSGVRLPQDRLNSGLTSQFLIIPISTAIYGWALHFTVGGLVVPIIAIFFAGLGLMMAFNSINTYCAEVLPSDKMEVIALKYAIQYFASGIASAFIVPLIEGVGIGWASMISCVIVMIGGCLVLITAKYGYRMQRYADRWRKKISERE